MKNMMMLKNVNKKGFLVPNKFHQVSFSSPKSPTYKNSLVSFKNFSTAPQNNAIFPPVTKNVNLSSFEEYKKLYDQSIKNPEEFWKQMALKYIDWQRPFDIVKAGGFELGDIAWFINGQLNVSVNCIDRHLPHKANDVAILWEGDEIGQNKSITYQDLLHEVCRVANLLKEYGIRKGDTVAIYMPMVPELVYTMLACARIGAIHNVVFAGFSAESLRSRINDSKAKILFTSNESMRAGKPIPLKQIADEALYGCPLIQHVFVHQRTNNKVPFHPSRDIWLHDAVKRQRPYCPPESMNSEDPLFILYTSGSTGAPKGLVHTTAGYLLYVSLTHRYIFGYKEGDKYACMGDIGWITGHSYVVYGPLVNGSTTLVFESLPTYPNPSRYWEMIERHKINIFYTAPTAIRTLMKYGSEPLQKYNRSSLRVLGSVGEPINPEAWKWYYDVVGSKKCDIVDTYWQTETGGIVITPIAGVTPTKPGSATLPFFGIQPVLFDSQGKKLEGNNKEGILGISGIFPSLTRTVLHDHSRYLKTYMHTFKGYYFTGDGCKRDEDGYIWITGRVDDVITKAGHRIGTAEIESALVTHPACNESAVVPIPDEVTGESIVAYCTLKHGFHENEQLINDLKQEVKKQISAIARPDKIIICSALPKTRSGKIMRRILRKIAEKQTSPEQLGDTSTLSDPEIINELIEKINKI